jgi:hypothetical protein
MRRCVALLVTSLAKPRERKVIFSAVKACLLSNSDQIICTQLQKNFSTSIAGLLLRSFILSTCTVGQNKRPEVPPPPLPASLLQPRNKMTLPLQKFDFANLSSILLVS